MRKTSIGLQELRKRIAEKAKADPRQDMFGFQSLNVYTCAIRFLALAMKHAAVGTSGTGGIPDQLRRAALSIPLNIAEVAPGKAWEEEA